MPARRTRPEPKRTRRRPATTPETRENQLISDAMDLAGRQIQDGSASSQVITHYLKLGSSRERLEQERLHNENVLLEAKKTALESEKKIEELYENAIRAMRSYRGEEELEPGEDEI